MNGSLTVHRTADVVDDDGCSTSGEIEGIEPAESSAGSGDDHDLTGEVDHRPSIVDCA